MEQIQLVENIFKQNSTSSTVLYFVGIAEQIQLIKLILKLILVTMDAALSSMNGKS